MRVPDTLIGGDDADQLFGDSDQAPTACMATTSSKVARATITCGVTAGTTELLGGLERTTLLHGEDGADRLDGGSEEDLLFGMDGDDTLLAAEEVTTN